MSGLAGLLLFALAALALAPFLMDWNLQRERLAAWLSRPLGVEVVLGGDVALRFLPTPWLEAESVLVGEDLYVDALRVEGDWLSLLRGEARVTRVAARGVTARMRRSGEGWDGVDWGGLELLLGMERVALAEARIYFRDELLGAEWEARVVEAEVEGGADLLRGSGRVRVVVASEGAAWGEQVEARLGTQAASGSAAARVSLALEADKGEVGFQGIWRGGMLEGEVEASGEMAGQAAEASMGVEVDVAAAVARMSQLDARWGEMRWRGEGTARMDAPRPHVEMALRSPSLDVAAGREAWRMLSALPLLVEGELGLGVDNLLWRGESLGGFDAAAAWTAEGEASARVSFDDLPGGGSASWDGRRLSGGAGEVAEWRGALELALEQPHLLARDFLGLSFFPSMREAVAARGQAMWSEAGAFALEEGAARWGEREMGLSARGRMSQEGLQVERLHIGNAGSEADWWLEGDGELRFAAVEGVWHPEGVVRGRLRLPPDWLRERLPPVLEAGAPETPAAAKAAEAAEAFALWRGEWRFLPLAADRLLLTAESGNGRITITSLLDLLRVEGAATGRVAVSLRHGETDLAVRGTVGRGDELFRGRVRMEGARPQVWLAALPVPTALPAAFGGEAEAAARAFLLRGRVEASGERIGWREMDLSWEDGGESRWIRGEGAWESGASGRRLQARLHADDLNLPPMWVGAALSEQDGGRALPDMDIALQVERLRLGALPMEGVSLTLTGLGGVDRMSAEGGLFGGRARMEVGASGVAPRWRAAAEGVALAEVSRFLWGDAFVRGTGDFALDGSGLRPGGAGMSGLGTARLADVAVCCIDVEGMRARAAAEDGEGELFAASPWEEAPADGDWRAVPWSDLGGGALVLSLADGVLLARSAGGAGFPSLTAELSGGAEWLLRLAADFPVAAGAGGREAEVGWRLEGDLFRPLARLDVGSLQQALEAERLRRVLEELEAEDFASSEDFASGEEGN